MSICDYSDTMLLRSVTEEDWDYILKLRNNSYNFFEIQKEPIQKNEHYLYMKRKEKDPDFHQYLYKNKSYIRVDGNDISVITDPKFRRQGLATEAIVEICKLHGTNLFAKIRMDNLSSFSSFFKAVKILQAKETVDNPSLPRLVKII